MLDIETIMDEIMVLAKIWVPYYCWEMNIEKGDSLLGQLEILTTDTLTPIRTSDGRFIVVSGDPGENGFYEDGYYKWYMTDYPVHSISFLQAVLGDPQIIAGPHDEATINRYTISLFTFFHENFNVDQMPRIKARYNRIFRKFLIKNITPVYGGSATVSERAAILEDPSGVRYEMSGITFTVDVEY